MPPLTKLPGGIADFLNLGSDRQRDHLAGLRGDRRGHAQFLHESLATVYAHLLGYQGFLGDSPAADDLEIGLMTAKVVLERELVDHWIDNWLPPEPPPSALLGPAAVARYLQDLAQANPGVHHPLFRYLESEASARALATFLHCEVMRNEVVDDEVALLCVGLQGQQKAAVAANLWDECGRGSLTKFHTYWLRRLLDVADGWTQFHQFRRTAPWFTSITSNVFSMLLTRPGYTQHAYGAFLINESWVAAHFEKVLAGLDRVGMNERDRTIYFRGHLTIDPRHAWELRDGIIERRPDLTEAELGALVDGARLAVAAGVSQFDRMLSYLSSM